MIIIHVALLFEVFAAILLARSWVPSIAVAAGPGRIDGHVVNGTVDGRVPTGVAIAVHAFRERSKIGERAVLSDDGGAFSVDGLDVGSEYLYFVIADYGGVGYYPERPIVFDGESEKRVEIRVFDSTDVDDAIQIDRANLLVLRASPTDLAVMEMGAVSNPSDRTYVGAALPGSRSPTLHFSLPEGADQIAPQAGLTRAELTPTPDGFYVSEPVTPGRHEMAFSYQIPLEGPTLDLVKRQTYPTASFNLYVPDNGISVVSPQLTYQGTAELGGQRYQLYGAQALPRGATLAARLRGLPAPFRPRLEQLGFLVVGLGGLLLGTGALVSILRQRHAGAGTRAEPVGASTNVQLDGERDRIVRVLAQLDDRYANGEMDEARYSLERRQNKEQLLALLAASPER